MELPEELMYYKKQWEKKNWWMMGLLITICAIGFVLFLIFHNKYIIVGFALFWIAGVLFINKKKMDYINKKTSGEEINKIEDNSESEEELIAKIIKSRNNSEEQE